MAVQITDVLSISAALVSAVGGLLAAGAALHSAASAKKAQQSADHSEKRAILLKIFETASQIVVEGNRIKERSGRLKGSYRSLMIMSGMSQSSGADMAISAIDAKARQAEILTTDAQVYATDSDVVAGSGEDIEVVTRRLSHSLVTVRAILEDMDIEQARMEGQLSSRR